MPRKGDCKPVIDRINGKYVVNEYTHCWIWQRSLSSQTGYPTISIRRGTPEYVYKVLWELRNGPMPASPSADGTRWEFHHGCANKRCINPAHIVLMTRDKHIKEERRMREQIRAAKTSR